MSKSLIAFHRITQIFLNICSEKLMQSDHWWKCPLFWPAWYFKVTYNEVINSFFSTNEVRIRLVHVNYTIVFKVINLLTWVAICIFKKQLEETFSTYFVFGEKNCWGQALEPPTLYAVCWITYFSFILFTFFYHFYAQSTFLNDWGRNTGILAA